MSDVGTGGAPRVSVVMPSYNQGRFIAQAIDSVLSQALPGLELLVVDGGSTDGTVEVLRGYGDRLRWISEADGGQSQAINKGLLQSSGTIVAWLNSDDVYLPGALRAAVQALEAHPDAGWLYGHGRVLDVDGRDRGRFEATEPFQLTRLLRWVDYVLQPTAFFRRELVERVGGVDEGLRWAMDWDLWLRFTACADPLFLDRELACTREHSETKTSTGGWRRIGELRRLMARHTGHRWTPGVWMYALDTLVQQLRRTLPRRAGDLVTLPPRALARRIHDRFPVQRDGTLRPRALLDVPRRWGVAVLELEVVPHPVRPARLSVDAGLGALHFTAERSGRYRLRVPLAPGGGAFGQILVEGAPTAFQLRCTACSPA